MGHFISTVVTGLSNGSIYGALALALVLIYRSTGIVNFAQGEMAMFATYVAWALIHAGVPLALAVLTVVVMGFVAGCLIERVIIQPVERQGDLTIIMVTLGLYIALQGGAGWIWGYDTQSFPSLLPSRQINLLGGQVNSQSLGMVAVLLLLAGILYLGFTRTKLGLGVRAAAMNPDSSRLVGISVGRMLMVGWGLAAALGALAGMLVANQILLTPTMMDDVLIYSFAAMALGGMDSPIGAIVGGWIVGILEALAGTYIGWIGGQLEILVPLILICVVLLIRPRGLLGSRMVTRV